eukprot:COSAG02_NODE_10312_length_1972_cov_19.937533_3_plen_20_part_01
MQASSRLAEDEADGTMCTRF